MDKAHFNTTSPEQILAKLAANLAKLNEADYFAAMQERSIDDILASRDSNDKEGEEENDEEEDKYEEDTEIEEGGIPPCYHPAFWTTGTNTNPFTSWGKTIGGSEKKKVKKKDTL